MSLILKGIDLPSKDKSPLVITVWADGVVCSVDSDGGIEETTSAIQIPNDHGRLIDGDKLIERLKSDNPQTSKNKWVAIVTECAPTVLEAEGSDENQI